MEHTETNEDWKELIREKAKKISCDEEEAELYVQDIIYIVSAKIHSIRQSDKELILGKMVYKIPTKHDRCTLDDNYCYNHQEVMKDDELPNGAYDYNEALDTCKSIVEEVMK